MKSPKSDPQREQLYALENMHLKWWLRSETSWPLLVDLAARTCRRYGVPQVKLIRRRNQLNAGEYNYWRCSIYLHGHNDDDDYTGRNVPVLLHELAHHVNENRYPRVGDELSVAVHGPEFVSVYRHLLHREKIISRDVFDKLCRSYGVECAA